MQGAGVFGMGAEDDNLSAARYPFDVEHGEVEALLYVRYDLWLVQRLHSTQTTFISPGASLALTRKRIKINLCDASAVM